MSSIYVCLVFSIIPLTKGLVVKSTDQPQVTSNHLTSLELESNSGPYTVMSFPSQPVRSLRYGIAFSTVWNCHMTIFKLDKG